MHEVGATHGPRVSRDGVRKKQLLDHGIIRLAGCVPQPPDSVPPHMVSYVGLASAGGPAAERWRGRLGHGGGP